jgi:hypothetical protein
MKPTVYWGGAEEHPVGMHEPIPTLMKEMLSLLERGDTLMNCPAFIDSIKNTYVLKAPFDIRFDKKGDAWFENEKIGDAMTLASPAYSQFMLGRTFFFADADVNMTLISPYMHVNNVYSMSGTFNIARWFRPISYTLHRSCMPCTIKSGEALMYVKFDKAVNLKQVTIPESTITITQAAMNSKHWFKSTALGKRYDLFMANRYNKVILKKIKEYNDA